MDFESVTPLEAENLCSIDMAARFEFDSNFALEQMFNQIKDVTSKSIQNVRICLTDEHNKRIGDLSAKFSATPYDERVRYDTLQQELFDTKESALKLQSDFSIFKEKSIGIISKHHTKHIQLINSAPLQLVFNEWAKYSKIRKMEHKYSSVVKNAVDKNTVSKAFYRIATAFHQKKTEKVQAEAIYKTDVMMKEVIQKYEAEITQLKSDLSAAYVLISHERNHRLQVEEKIKRIFLKNMTAMNIEAMSLFEHVHHQHSTDTADPVAGDSSAAKKEKKSTSADGQARSSTAVRGMERRASTGSITVKAPAAGSQSPARAPAADGSSPVPMPRSVPNALFPAVDSTPRGQPSALKGHRTAQNAAKGGGDVAAAAAAVSVTKEPINAMEMDILTIEKPTFVSHRHVADSDAGNAQEEEDEVEGPRSTLQHVASTPKLPHPQTQFFNGGGANGAGGGSSYEQYLHQMYQSTQKAVSPGLAMNVNITPVDVKANNKGSRGTQNLFGASPAGCSSAVKGTPVNPWKGGASGQQQSASSGVMMRGGSNNRPVRDESPGGGLAGLARHGSGASLSATKSPGNVAAVRSKSMKL